MSRTTPALTDQASLLRTIREGAKVEGRTLSAEVAGAACRARLVPDRVIEDRDAEGQRRVLVTATLVLGSRDDQGDEVTPTVADRVEVRSRNESTIWQVRSVEPVYRRRRLLGTVCAVERLEDQRVASVMMA